LSRVKPLIKVDRPPIASAFVEMMMRVPA
jgi:hypothetical protein